MDDPFDRKQESDDAPADGASIAEVRLKLLTMVALADGSWDPRENSLLSFLAVKFGLTTKDLEEMRNDPSLSVHELANALPKDNAGRIDLLSDLIRVAQADRQIHDQELALLVKLGKALGFEADEVESIVKEM